MTDKERVICQRINDCLEAINDETEGSVISPARIRELELACFDLTKTIPVSAETANFVMEIMHQMYHCSKEKELYPYMDALEAILYPNFEFDYIFAGTDK